MDPTTLARYQAQLLDAIDRALASDDAPPLEGVLREAVRAVPRHVFVHRFTSAPGGPVRELLPDAPSPELLDEIYRDHWLGHVAPDGTPLPSTNSVPSYMLRLLAALDLRAGQRVLEVGSGSGWLAAVIAHCVGGAGRVVGVEILPSLVEQSRASLARAGIDNVEVHCADGANGHEPAAPFDCAIVTAATYDLPAALFEQVREGGSLLVPLIDPAAIGCEVLVLARRDGGFVKRTSVRGHFVSLAGAAARANPRECRLDALDGVTPSRECARHALTFGASTPSEFAPATAAFRAFLARRDARYVVASRGDPATRRWFGLAEPDGTSIALCTIRELTGYGTRAATDALLAHYAAWCRLGMPGPEAFDLRVERAAGAAVKASALEDVRGDAVLQWTLRRGLEVLPGC